MGVLDMRFPFLFIKVAVRRETAAGRKMVDSSQMVACIKDKFSSLREPVYYFKEITIDKLESARVATQKIIHRRVDGSSRFQALVIYLNCDIIKASPRLCSYRKFLADYGSCELFQEFQLFL